MIPEAVFARLQSPLLLVARAMLALIFILEGSGKISAYSDVSAYMSDFGVSPQLLPLVIVTELGGGLLVLLGVATRTAAFALTGFCLLTAILFHRNGDVDQQIEFQKNVAIAGGFLLLVVCGPGGWSIERLWRQQKAFSNLSSNHS